MMNSTIEARVTHHFQASPEQVFDAWLQPEAVRRWLRAALREMGLEGDIREVQIDARPGGAFLFSDLRDGTEARHWGTYVEFDRPGRLAFTWITDESEESNPSRVTITIEPAPGGCNLTLVHEMDQAWAEYLSRTEQAWTRMLKAMGTQMVASDPRI